MAQGQATKVKKKKKSVLKRAAQSLQRAEVNRANRTRVRTMMRRLRTAITAGDATAAGNLLQPTMSAIDQAIAKNVLHENTANRYSLASPWLTTASKRRPPRRKGFLLFDFAGFCRGGPRPASSFFFLRGPMPTPIPVSSVSQPRLTQVRPKR